MPPRIYYEDDADLAVLDGKTIAIIGFGAQGHAHAQNLRDSGLEVVVGQRAGASFKRAQSHGFEPVSAAEATAQADIVNLMLPDEMHAEVYQAEILPQLETGNVLMCCHGFSMHFGYVKPPPQVEPLLVAPKGAGHAVRSEYQRGSGVPCLIAVSETASDATFRIGLAYAKGIGGTRRGVIQTTFAEETETDLFGEQAVLCGGISALIKAGYETLVDAGYQPEMAYFECLHETKLIVDLLYRGGLSYMRDHISNTAEYGDYTRGPRIITDQTRAEMKRILDEVRSARFAEEWMHEHQSGGTELARYRKIESAHPIEEIGRSLRKMMFDSEQ